MGSEGQTASNRVPEVPVATHCSYLEIFKTHRSLFSGGPHFLEQMTKSVTSSLPVQAIRRNIDEVGILQGLKQWGTKAYLRKVKSVSGINYFDKEWDVLVVLDACRYDLLVDVQDEYRFISDIGSRISLGSATWEWMPATFKSTPESVLKETAYVCGNPYSAQFLEEDSFLRLDEVWSYAWDDQLGTVPPRPVTDRAIAAGRELNAERMVVHYMQPHVPFINSSDSPGLSKNFHGDDTTDDWNLVKSGEKDIDQVMTEYRDNLRAVLSEVEILLSNIDADRVVVTSDHGNATGEYGLFGHNDQVPIQALYKVPWVEVSASDTGEHVPEEYHIDETTDQVDSRLKALGYK